MNILLHLRPRDSEKVPQTGSQLLLVNLTQVTVHSGKLTSLPAGPQVTVGPRSDGSSNSAAAEA